MSVWTLTIDLRTDRQRHILSIALLDHDRVVHWTYSQPLSEAEVQHLQELSKNSFSNHHAEQRRERMTELGRYAEICYIIENAMDQSNVYNSDSIIIDTLVTFIPWDLLYVRDDFLGHKISVGLRVPPFYRRSQQTRFDSKSRPRFLHIICNPKGDLVLNKESNDIKSILNTLGDAINYHPINNPTEHELLSELLSCSNTPFIHYSGHVIPSNGILLGDNTVFDRDRIARHFSFGEKKIVFLNGCDSIFDDDKNQHDGDMFKQAFVANAFLDSGAFAVISPRTKILDSEASVAAGLIWHKIFSGVELGHAVRECRKEMFKKDPNSLASYSYVLYGNPSHRVDSWVRDSKTHGKDTHPEQALADISIIRRAYNEVGSPVFPQHILGVLSREWIVAHIYYEAEYQSYIGALERLRQELGVGLPADCERAGSVELNRVSLEIVKRMSSKPNFHEDEYLACLEALAEIDDRNIELALKSLQFGPRTAEELLLAARKWVADGCQVPMSVFVHPCGMINQTIWLPNYPTESVPIAGDIVGCWDLLLGLIVASPKLCTLWPFSMPPQHRWQAGQRLHWGRLDEDAKEANMDAMEMRIEEGQPTITEGMLLRCLLDEGRLDWCNLPGHAKFCLNGVSDVVWSNWVRDMGIRCLGLLERLA